MMKGTCYEDKMEGLHHPQGERELHPSLMSSIHERRDWVEDYWIDKVYNASFTTSSSN